MADNEEFMKANRDTFIQKTRSPVVLADALLQKKCITKEMYNKIVAKETNQDQIRECFACLNSKTHFDCAYDWYKEHESALIKELGKRDEDEGPQNKRSRRETQDEADNTIFPDLKITSTFAKLENWLSEADKSERLIEYLETKLEAKNLKNLKEGLKDKELKTSLCFNAKNIDDIQKNRELEKFLNAETGAIFPKLILSMFFKKRSSALLGKKAKSSSDEKENMDTSADGYEQPSNSSGYGSNKNSTKNNDETPDDVSTEFRVTNGFNENEDKKDVKKTLSDGQPQPSGQTPKDSPPFLQEEKTLLPITQGSVDMPEIEEANAHTSTSRAEPSCSNPEPAPETNNSTQNDDETPDDISTEFRVTNGFNENEDKKDVKKTLSDGQPQPSGQTPKDSPPFLQEEKTLLPITQGSVDMPEIEEANAHTSTSRAEPSCSNPEPAPETNNSTQNDDETPDDISTEFRVTNGFNENEDKKDVKKTLSDGQPQPSGQTPKDSPPFLQEEKTLLPITQGSVDMPEIEEANAHTSTSGAEPSCSNPEPAPGTNKMKRKKGNMLEKKNQSKTSLFHDWAVRQCNGGEIKNIMNQISIINKAEHPVYQFFTAENIHLYKNPTTNESQILFITAEKASAAKTMLQYLMFVCKVKKAVLLCPEEPNEQQIKYEIKGTNKYLRFISEAFAPALALFKKIQKEELDSFICG